MALGKTTRQQILDLLAARDTATASDISQIIHITHANSRYHLNNLETEGLVRVIGYSQPLARKGRPARQYQLTSTFNENNMDILSHLLLTKLKSLVSETEWSECMFSIAKGFSSGATSLSSPRNLGSRLNFLVRFLNEKHYHARWEARPDSPSIILEHCPYRMLVDQHPELCVMDSKLINEILYQPVELVDKLCKNQDGIEFCVFRVQRQ